MKPLDSVTKEIKEYYSFFDDEFSQIDSWFNSIDENGDSNNETIINIISYLISFQDKCYKDKVLTEDKNEFKVFIEKCNKSEFDLLDVLQVVKELQKKVHDFLVYDTKWPGQKDCICLIRNILNRLRAYINSTSDINIVDTHSLVRILRELVADCSISIRGLGPLSSWSYGTVEYSKLKSYDQLMVLINQAILIDRMYFCMRSLKGVLNNVNKILQGLIHVNWKVYYAAGLLNFKIHQYKEASTYFQKICNNEEVRRTSNAEEKQRFFHSNLLIAYCHEYSGEFDKAIEAISINVGELAEILKSYTIQDIEKEDPFEKIMKALFEKSKNYSQSLMALNKVDFSEFIKHADDKNLDDTDVKFEILHALAHCMNEYAIKRKTQLHDKSVPEDTITIIDCAKIIALARKLMKTLAQFRPDYWTCYATIHGESQDYYQALEELNAIEKRYNEKGVRKKETVSAEISFFKYYFGLLINQSYDKDRDLFEQYYRKYDDDDAKCHLKIFVFKEELRKAFSGFFKSINSADLNEEKYDEDSIYKIPSSLSEKYMELCELEPTLYMNVNVRAELRLVQRAYECLCALRDYIIEPSRKRLCHLENMCCRFSIVKKDMGLSVDSTYSNNESDNKSDIEVQETQQFPTSHIPDSVEKAFSCNKEGILSCLYSYDSIFILAPISGIVVYQYQTGNIKNLFDMEAIIPKDYDDFGEDVQNIVSYLWGNFIQVSVHYGQSMLTQIPWEKLSKYSSVVYLWSEKVPSQVIVSTQKSCYVRILKDEKGFANTIKKYVASNSRNMVCERNPQVQCVVHLERTHQWIEILNEEAKDVIFIIVWLDTNQDKKRCYIIPSEERDLKKIKMHKHDIHDWTKGIQQYSGAQSQKIEKIDEGIDLEESNIDDTECSTMLTEAQLYFGKVDSYYEQCITKRKKAPSDSHIYSIWSEKEQRFGEYRKQLMEIITLKNKKMSKEEVEEKHKLINKIKEEYQSEKQ